ncbi:hypothetical protein HQ346_21880 [Rhodococcus sp. BP-252]|uniref:Dynamin family protein n=1 Tax=Rhodococcoides kyotonense TaxID=398843 RepID=A0A177YD26_9NOCA|nr:MULTISPECIES: hypothetical protein [Rhodococcus]MBY6412930.1 hypothetical protein [Rhodococcus sp. BP-320]MBY6419468.1 hypothetical protein [Rhodococcus sp. BP-321]MBY6423876.1 hypothetical protein [Rhodococcus sp. BP-324]MBY6429114.1 hypothetical protein [Rhodococcus sp. BP-323]MBY6432852.1 hypothetical protein [Rhodococcus sp. BP-322]
MIDVPGDMGGVIRRWFPDGLDAVGAARRAVPEGLFVTGIHDADVTTLLEELRHLGVTPTAARVDSAAVVMFAVDASSPIGRRALAEMRPALESTTVAIVVNGIDAHREWREVTRSVASSIAEHVPRAVDVEVWPTSAGLARRARHVADAAARDALYEESGIAALGAFLADALQRPPGMLRERKYNAAVHAAVAGARRAIVDRAREVTGTGATVGLRAERADLLERRDRERRVRTTTLRNRLQMLRVDVTHEIGEESRTFVAGAREAIASATRSELRHLPADLSQQLTKAGRRVDGGVTERVQAIATDVEIDIELPSTATQLARIEPPARRRRTVEDKVMVVVGASAGVGLARIVVSPLSMLPAFEVAVVPAALLLGAFSAWWVVRARASVADRAHLRTWTSDAAASAKSSWEQAAQARMLAVEEAFVSASTDSIGTATLAAESELDRVESELRTAADHRASVLAACDRDLAALDRGVERFVVAAQEPALSEVRPNN